MRKVSFFIMENVSNVQKAQLGMERIVLKIKRKIQNSQEMQQLQTQQTHLLKLMEMEEKNKMKEMTKHKAKRMLEFRLLDHKAKRMLELRLLDHKAKRMLELRLLDPVQAKQKVPLHHLQHNLLVILLLLHLLPKNNLKIF